ncbi:hypothetical protein C7212DRAFT_365029 [Tuber magnatum]|uniref:Methyltransferase domain-containing protein n=1 Tax=Tuber magnatum TaxID=42249 RepID=A0A317SJZ5_9PEZI|nr:hypothetical protein C7212DRAFT_365029 [Tuber magnatum]
MADLNSSYAYISPRFPVFYDAWVFAMFGNTHSDTSVYQKYLRSYSHRLVILDLCTGTGRVVRGLGRDYPHKSLEDAIIYGIDHAPAMVQRARATSAPTHPTQEFKWKVAPATGFYQVLDNGDKVDLLINSAGSISHLPNRRDVRLFLGQVKKSLRPETGVALISVLTEMIHGPQEEEEIGESNDPVEHGMGALVLPCKDDGEGLSGQWHKSPTKVIWNEDKTVRTDSFCLELRTDDGTVAWREDLHWELALFDEDAWAADVQGAGLEVVDTVPEGDTFQRFYVLSNPII